MIVQRFILLAVHMVIRRYIYDQFNIMFHIIHMAGDNPYT